MTRRSRILQSPKVIEKKRKKNIITAFLFSFCIIIFLIVVVLFFRLPFLQISYINIEGVKTLNTSEIKEKVSESLIGYYLYFIPRSNIFFYPKSLVKEKLIESFKKIETIEIKRESTKTLRVVISEKTPIALACRSFHEETIDEKNIDNENCYFVDKDGYVFEKAPQFSNGIYIRYYVITDLGDDIVGTNFIDSSLFQKMQNMIEIARKSDIYPTGILIGLEGDYEMYIKNKDNSETTVLFDNRAPFDKTISNLIAFILDSRTKKRNATSTTSFDSINLRFGNNIFYVPKQL